MSTAGHSDDFPHSSHATVTFPVRFARFCRIAWMAVAFSAEARSCRASSVRVGSITRTSSSSGVTSSVIPVSGCDSACGGGAYTSAAMPALEAGEGAAAPRYHFMRRVHSRSGAAYCVISIHLDHRIFRMAPKRFRSETVIPVLLDLPRVKIANARQRLTIGTADVEVAGFLGIPVNSPVAEVRRTCTDRSGTVIYLGEVTYRGDFVRLEMDLAP